MHDPNAAQTETRYGWVMVAVTPLFMALGAGALSSISVFLKPVTADLGWPRGDTAFAYLAGTMALGLGGIVMGYLADRISIRAVTAAGAFSLGAALLLLSRQRSLWEFYLYYCLLGGLGVGAFYAPLLANVGNWFERNKGLALGVTTAAVALGQGGVIYASRYLITALDWQGAYRILGFTFWAILLPLSLLVRNPPVPAARLGGAAGLALPSGECAPLIAPGLAVSWISLAVIFCCIVMATALVHGVALAQDLVIEPQSAAGVVSLMWLSGVVGRIACGGVNVPQERLAEAIWAGAEGDAAQESLATTLRRLRGQRPQATSEMPCCPSMVATPQCARPFAGATGPVAPLA
jgi:MFS family permease